MGRNLFIRVSAVTYDEERMAKDWPVLCQLVWPEPSGVAPDKERIAKTFGNNAHGILELSAGVVDHITYGSLPDAQRKVLLPLNVELHDSLKGLEQALGNRDVHAADALTNKIEDTLDAMEAALGGK